MLKRFFSTKCLGREHLPYKSPAVALLFAVFLGPIGLLYANYWSGIVMMALGIIVCSHPYFFTVLLVWLISCILSVSGCERYNQKIALALSKKENK